MNTHLGGVLPSIQVRRRAEEERVGRRARDRAQRRTQRPPHVPVELLRRGCRVVVEVDLVAQVPQQAGEG